jgi:NADH-quinone oxidoreductase subunit F
METEILIKVRKQYQSDYKNIEKQIIVCTGTGCMANGALRIFNKFQSKLKNQEYDIKIEKKEKVPLKESVTLKVSGCPGFCQIGPLVEIQPDNILYVGVHEKDVEEIVDRTIKKGEIIERLLFKDINTNNLCRGNNDILFYQKQKRITLKLCGIIDPENIHEYIYMGGYEAAEKCYLNYTSEQICNIIEKSGLRGRGGGGFPTGKKWDLARKEISEEKSIICNGDEGDPGAFMDRGVMEGNPHAVLEGMIIAAKAIGANKGYIYVRAEYPLAVKRMEDAIIAAKEIGILGDSVFGSGVSFHLEVMMGAGAFVCGEETALISSLMGRRGMPRPKPPFPSHAGLNENPTVINNVETLATVPYIINYGAEKFRSIGTSNSPGTKTFALSGHVVNNGLIEVPFGTTLREIIFTIGGGVTGDKQLTGEEYFKVVQIGGPSGACLTKDHLDIALDYDSLKNLGAMIGSGGLVVMNTSTCMVQLARYFMQFTQKESCGKCVPCREGTRQMLNLLDDIIAGNGTEDTINNLIELGNNIKISALCGLGKSAPNPVLSTLKYFRDEYIAHVKEKRCPTGQCKSLRKPEIDPILCKGCMVCVRACPVGAITGEKKKTHYIDDKLCIRCGSCASVCKFSAIIGVGGSVK